MFSDASSAVDKVGVRLNMKSSPEVYRSQKAQNEVDSTVFLERYKSKIKWKLHGDRTIDLGSGDGGMTRVLEKFLPLNYEKLVGCDINPSMVKYAKKNCSSDRVKFYEMDIEGDMPKEWRKGFDHVFSFYTLHWVKDQEKAFRNIFELIAEDGDCLLLFVARHPIYDMFLALSNMEKWSSYLRDVNNFLSPYYYYQEPDMKISDMMESIGFSHVDVRCKQMLRIESLESFISFAMVVNPFDIPNELKNEFLADVEGVLRDFRLIHRKEAGVETVVHYYNVLVVHGAK